MLNPLIQNQLDYFLFEEGSFSPLNWLLREGHLDYNDYLDWKKGKINYLEDHFNNPIKSILTALDEAKDYAALLKLESFRQTYSSIDDRQLNFCRSPGHELIYTTVYEPAHDRVQMDLFFDSADTCAISNLISAIVDEHSEAIPGLMVKLASLNPDKHQQFRQLLALAQKVSNARLSCEQKIELTLQKVTPLAFEILGRFTHDFLTPLWHQLSVEVATQSFDAKKPNNHLSFTAFKEFQWQQVLAVIKQEKGWIQQSLLLFRYAESCFKLNREREGIDCWCRLFILFPNDAKRLITDSCHRVMFADWQSFSELDPKLEPTLFPAWRVLNKPAFAQNMDFFDMTDNVPMQLIVKLVCNKDAVINKTAIQLRARLQQDSPALFVHYMRVHARDQ